MTTARSISYELYRFFYFFLLTGSIARSAKRQLFKVTQRPILRFWPRRGDTLHRWGEIWQVGGAAKFQPHRCNDKGIGPQN